MAHTVVIKTTDYKYVKETAVQVVTLRAEKLMNGSYRLNGSGHSYVAVPTKDGEFRLKRDMPFAVYDLEGKRLRLDAEGKLELAPWKPLPAPKPRRYAATNYRGWTQASFEPDEPEYGWTFAKKMLALPPATVQSPETPSEQSLDDFLNEVLEGFDFSSLDS